MPKVFDGASSLMAFVLIHEAKQKISSLLNEEFFAHGWEGASMRRKQ